MNLKIAQVIGLNTDQKAAQVISDTQNGDNAFFAVLDLSCDDAFTKGRQILSELSDFYFDFEGSPSEKLNATFEKAKEKIAQNEYSLLTASISGKILYLISKGEIEVHLKRDEKLSPLLQVGAPDQLISGFLQEGDKLLLSTKSLINFLGEDLEKSLNLSVDSFEEEVTDRIGASNLENQGLAALALEVEGEQIQEEKENIIPGLEEEKTLYKDDKGNRLGSVTMLVSFFGKLFNLFPKSGRGRLVLAVVLIIIITSGVFLKFKASQDAQKQLIFNQNLQAAKDDFIAAKGLASLNPAEAKGKLDSAKDKVNKALSLKPKDQEAKDLKNQIEQESSSILKQESVSEFPVFLDLDLVKEKFSAKNLSLSAGKLLLLDPAVKTLVSIDLSKKSHQIQAGSEQLGDATASSINGGMAFVYSKDKGILRIDTDNQKVATVSAKNEDFGEISDIAGFASNVYALDSIKNQIWKYLPTSGGYSAKREYLTKETKADFSQSLRMQIESSIYILKSGGEILRFTKGNKDNFSYDGLPSSVKDPKSFFVSSDTENLYLLDSGNSRLLILTKTGSYKGEIKGDKFAQATDLVVDEEGKKVYLLDGSKIYMVDLK